MRGSKKRIRKETIDVNLQKEQRLFIKSSSIYSSRPVASFDYKSGGKPCAC
jgi:hypothetical protein